MKQRAGKYIDEETDGELKLKHAKYLHIFATFIPKSTDYLTKSIRELDRGLRTIWIIK